MWARYVELLLAGWLALSPFIFRLSPDEPLRWLNNLVCAAVVGTCALLSFWPRLGPIHLLNALAGIWLAATGILGSELPPPPAIQNWVVVGLLLAMMGILPSHADQPPRAWREFRVPDRRSGAPPARRP